MLGKGKFFSSQIKNEYLVNRNTLFFLIILAAHTFFLKKRPTPYQALRKTKVIRISICYYFTIPLSGVTVSLSTRILELRTIPLVLISVSGVRCCSIQRFLSSSAI